MPREVVEVVRAPSLARPETTSPLGRPVPYSSERSVSRVGLDIEFQSGAGGKPRTIRSVPVGFPIPRRLAGIGREIPRPLLR